MKTKLDVSTVIVQKYIELLNSVFEIQGALSDANANIKYYLDNLAIEKAKYLGLSVGDYVKIKSGCYAECYLEIKSFRCHMVAINNWHTPNSIKEYFVNYNAYGRLQSIYFCSSDDLFAEISLRELIDEKNT